MPTLSRPTQVLVGVGAFLAAAYLTRQALNWSRREPSISATAIERSWTPQRFGNSDIAFDTPWPLKAASMPFPPEVSRTIVSSDVLSGEGNGMHIMAMHLSFTRETPSNLEGAAEGSIANMRSVPGTLSVSGGKQPTDVLGIPGFEIEARIERQQGGPLQLHGLVFGHAPELYQLQFIAKADQPLSNEAWKRLRSSLRRSKAA